MRIVELIRLESTSQGTFGILRVDKQIFCATLEPREYDNQKNVSCIPAQPYLVKPHESPRHGGTFQVQDVPGRTHILFHAGNQAEHTEGCILLGQHVEKLKHKRTISNSGATFRRFLAELGRQPFRLIIYECY